MAIISQLLPTRIPSPASPLPPPPASPTVMYTGTELPTHQPYTIPMGTVYGWWEGIPTDYTHLPALYPAIMDHTHTDIHTDK